MKHFTSFKGIAQILVGLLLVVLGYSVISQVVGPVDSKENKAQPVAEKDPTAYRIPQLSFDKGKGKVIEMDRMRKMIAGRMVDSKRISPHVTSFVEADVTKIA